MECRLCLSSSPAEDLVSIHDDPRLLEHLIFTCCRLRVRQEDQLPDMVCLSCVNNLESLDGFRNACSRSATTSRDELDSSLKIKSEELLLDDLTWENESSADCPPNISSSAENGETSGGKITSNDNIAEIIDTNRHIPVQELPTRKASNKMCSTDCELDHIHSEFTEGQTFETYESVCQHFHKFCEQNYHPFVVRCHNSRQIIYSCCHGFQRKSKCQGIRPNQNYLYKGCAAKINMYKNKENKWKVTKVSLDHNHTIGKEEFKLYRRNSKLNEESLESMSNLILANVKDSIIAKEMEKKSGSCVTRKDVQNIRYKMFSRK
ncbi:uncharacterized protein LOC143913034 [Arctopsyche grandis]|uniref:uncharacterized protein LOC143913034 n=1 Tax=Arctopsyche grandis TaxID=121162 RepID=UPI00406D6B52